MSKEEINKRVEEAAKILDLEPYLDRKPKALSGGQRQRVAMGRAIVRKPQVFLMDEPLSNLDAKLRVQTRTQIASLQRELGVTTVYVTHDQTEALTMGDRIAVLAGGILQQCGTPQEMYERPANEFVAGFIGSPAMNLGTFTVDGEWAKIGPARVPLSEATRAALTPEDGGKIKIGSAPRAWTSSTRASRAPSPSRLTSLRNSAPTPTSTATWSATRTARAWAPAPKAPPSSDRARSPAHRPRPRRRPVRAHPRRPAAQLLSCHGRSSARVTRKLTLPC